MVSPLRRLEQLVREMGGSAPAIDAAIGPVLAANDASVIGPLLLLLRDDADEDGMWSILHAAESFDDEPYVRDVLRVLPLLNETSGRWSEIVIIRILNSEPTRAHLIRQLGLAPEETKGTLRSVCARLVGTNARLAEGLAEITAALGEHTGGR
jgi:hypothetical protein